MGPKGRRDVGFDLVVIGGGAAGLAAARTARRRGATVALVAGGPLGGECTFYGCVPSKTLIEAGHQKLEFTAAASRARSVIARIAATEDATVLRREGIEIIEGTARFVARGHLSVCGRDLRYARLVIATGSAPVVPVVPGIEAVGALTNETVFDLRTRPGSLLIVGGGPIGVELGQAFTNFGTSVTIVEAADRLLPGEEPEVSALVAQALEDGHVKVRAGRQVTEFSGALGHIAARLDDATTVHAEQLLVAVGRRPGTADLGLANAGINVDERGYIVTDPYMRTNVRGVYAAGDVTGRAMLSHAADEMGRTAASNALSRIGWHRFRDDVVPTVTYTRPEVARVGLTEQQAASVKGARVAELPLSELDRAIIAGRTGGYIKLIAAPRAPTGNLAGGKLIGATIVADRAGEMIALATLAMSTGMFPARLALTVQAYPTWALGLRQAAAQFFVESGGRRARPPK
jgi:pyruvate/2-oxoglutarate dehydrogenase complex dihydrolipoamide dehydrogenase (E3) component